MFCVGFVAFDHFVYVMWQLSDDHIVAHTTADQDSIILFTLKSYKSSSSSNMV